MPEVLDRPPLGLTLNEEELGGFGGFPDRLFLISVGDGRYACNNATLPDGQNINGLACFPSPDDATTYMGLLGGLSGDLVGKSFEEAREIAIGKPVLGALFLFVGGRIVEVHYIR
jgi:hypothetical protein